MGVSRDRLARNINTWSNPDMLIFRGSLILIRVITEAICSASNYPIP